jgi:hypothetical protein
MYLSRYIARREVVDGDEIGLMKQIGQDQSSAHLIQLKPRVALEASTAVSSLSSQYLCGTTKLDSEHVVCDVKI